MKIRSFLRKRSKEDIHQQMTEHLSRIHLATQSLVRAVDAWRKNDISALDHEVGIISAEENAADRLFAEICLNLTKGDLRSKLRSSVMTFVKRADEVAGYAKRASENFLILHKLRLTDHIYEELHKACEIVHMCSEKLIEALAIYRTDIRRGVDLTTEISLLEHQVDGLYSQLKNHYFEFTELSDNYAALLLFDHALRDIENAANSAEDASDVLRSMMISAI